MKLTIKQITQSYNGTNQKTGQPYLVSTFLGVDEEGNSKVYKSFSPKIVEGAVLEGEVKESEYEGTKEYIFNPSQKRSENRGIRSEEERLEIIRQSSLSNSINFLTLMKEANPEYVKRVKNVEDLFALAQRMVEWVKQSPQKNLKTNGKNDIEKPVVDR